MTASDVDPAAHTRDTVSLRSRAALLLLATALPCVACGGRSGSSPTESHPGLGSSVHLAADPASIIAGLQVAIITVQAFGTGGKPVPAGTAVNLTTDRGTLGSTALLCDTQGIAQTTLQPRFAIGTAIGIEFGTATVTASVAGITTSTQVTLRPRYDLQVHTSPSRIGSGGSATVVLQVTALDPSDSVDNLRPAIESSLGRLTPRGPVTDRQGVASACLAADGASGTALVTVSMPWAEPASATVVFGGHTASASSLRSCPP